jgi:hypothetical protein
MASNEFICKKGKMKIFNLFSKTVGVTESLAECSCAFHGVSIHKARSLNYRLTIIPYIERLAIVNVLTGYKFTV